jgi:hypothetical protein
MDFAPKIARSYTNTPPDPISWAAANAKVYENSPHTLDELKTTVMQFMQ